jgi:hypothetical protein
MKQSLVIIKVGGKIVEDAGSLDRLLKDFKAIPGNKLLVHGGGHSPVWEYSDIRTYVLNRCRVRLTGSKPTSILLTFQSTHSALRWKGPIPQVILEPPHRFLS